MTPLLINGLSVLMLLFFGAMALFPLFLPDRAGNQEADHEDRVLHISPAPMIERPAPAARHQPVAISSAPGSATGSASGSHTSVSDNGDTPSRREAA